MLILLLANWRIAHLLTSQEAGPYNILHRLRRKVGVRYTSENMPYATNELSALFICIWCMSLWTGLLITIFMWLSPKKTRRVLQPFALSGAAILLDKTING